MLYDCYCTNPEDPLGIKKFGNKKQSETEQNIQQLLSPNITPSTKKNQKIKSRKSTINDNLEGFEAFLKHTLFYPENTPVVRKFLTNIHPCLEPVIPNSFQDLWLIFVQIFELYTDYEQILRISQMMQQSGPNPDIPEDIKPSLYINQNHLISLMKEAGVFADSDLNQATFSKLVSNVSEHPTEITLFNFSEIFILSMIYSIPDPQFNWQQKFQKFVEKKFLQNVKSKWMDKSHRKVNRINNLVKCLTIVSEKSKAMNLTL